jgi:hypothetical protein
MELIESVTAQFNEEAGDLIEHPIPAKEKHMLRMKYGLSASQLTPSERYLIKNESN